MRRTELAGLLQRTESVEVGSYLVASPQLATGMGTATTRIAVATGCVPLASLRALERRGYAPVEGDGELIYVYDRRTAPAMPQVAGLMIERAGPELASLYSKTGFESFKDRGPQFVAIVDALVRSRRRGLRAFRGRGLQTAMIAHRIREGWARGYRIFFGQTVNPVSAHNMEDLGWRRLYTEVAWEKHQS